MYFLNRWIVKKSGVNIMLEFKQKHFFNVDTQSLYLDHLTLLLGQEICPLTVSISLGYDIFVCIAHIINHE